MRRALYLTAAGAALSLAAGCGSAGRPANPRIPGATGGHATCASLVGKPVTRAINFATQEVLCDQDDSSSAVSVSSCKYGDPASGRFAWASVATVGDNGAVHSVYYYGRQGGLLHYSSDQNFTQTQMRAAVGC